MPIGGNPLWFDDFLGITIDPRYRISVLGGSPAIVGIPTGSLYNTWGNNGQLLLNCPNTAKGDCRIRLGEDPSQGIDARNWNVANGIVHEVLVYSNVNSYMQSSIGFVGADDPNNFVTCYYPGASSASPPASGWQLGMAKGGPTGDFVNTGFVHTPGQWFRVRLQTSSSNVSLYINDSLLATYNGSKIPTMNLVPEINLYNRQDSPFSAAALWVDYIYITQIRGY